jgi:hypothetical protein
VVCLDLLHPLHHLRKSSSPAHPPTHTHHTSFRTLHPTPSAHTHTYTQLPQLIINTFGGGAFAFSSYTDISRTTLGNLVGALGDGTSAVTVPYCKDITFFHALNCNLDKAALAVVGDDT